MRFRNIFFVIGGLLVALIVTLSDPDVGVLSQLPFGASLVALAISTLIAIFYIGFLHISRKGMFDYIDLEQFFRKAIETPSGAGMAIIGIGLNSIAIALCIFAAVK